MFSDAHIRTLICDDLLISLGHQEHPLAKMSDAEIMTKIVILALN